MNLVLRKFGPRIGKRSFSFGGVGSIKQASLERASHTRWEVGLSEQGSELLHKVCVRVHENGAPHMF